jgi:hypothetical protein
MEFHVNDSGSDMYGSDECTSSNFFSSESARAVFEMLTRSRPVGFSFGSIISDKAEKIRYAECLAIHLAFSYSP